MKPLRLTLLGAVGILLLAAGCGSIELASSGNPERVLNGTVTVGAALPAGSEVVVRLIAVAAASEPVRPAGGDTPVVTRPASQGTDRVLGEQVQILAAGTMAPVPFRIEYTAEDALLRRGLNVEVRVSVDGRLRYRTVSAHVVTLASSPFRQDVAVQPVAR